MENEVIIIGGGIAGLSLAVDLGARGLPVTVIEKGSYPRHKVCGEYLSMESFAYLHNICPELFSLKLPKISKFTISSTGAFQFSTKLTPGGFGISRHLLEKMLYERALKKGVNFLLNTKAGGVQKEESGFLVQAGDRSLKARMVFDAAGRYSARSEKTAAPGYVAVKYHIRNNRDASRIEIHNFPGGYCGISNIEEEKSCLCYIISSDNLKRAGKIIRQAEERFLFRNRRLRDLFNSSEFLFEKPLAISGIEFCEKAPVRNGVFFLGDSSGTVAPITGNGMSQALRSACCLARLSIDYLDKKISIEEMEQCYSAMWRTNFSPKIRRSAYLQKLSEYPLLCKTTIGAFNLIPPLAAAVIRHTHGEEFT